MLEVKAEGPIRRGRTSDTVAKFLGRKIESTDDVTEYEPNKAFVTTTSAPFPLTITNLIEAGGRTRLTGIVERERREDSSSWENRLVARIAQKQIDARENGRYLHAVDG